MVSVEVEELINEMSFSRRCGNYYFTIHEGTKLRIVSIGMLRWFESFSIDPRNRDLDLRYFGNVPNVIKSMALW